MSDASTDDDVNLCGYCDEPGFRNEDGERVEPLQMYDGGNGTSTPFHPTCFAEMMRQGPCCGDDDHESAARTGEEIPEERRDTLPADAPIVCSVCSIPISLGDALDSHRDDGPLYCGPCHDKEYPS